MPHALPSSSYFSAQNMYTNHNDCYQKHGKSWKMSTSMTAGEGRSLCKLPHTRCSSNMLPHGQSRFGSTSSGKQTNKQTKKQTNKHKPAKTSKNKQTNTQNQKQKMKQKSERVNERASTQRNPLLAIQRLPQDSSDGNVSLPGCSPLGAAAER